MFNLQTMSISEGRERLFAEPRGRLRFVEVFVGLFSIYLKIMS